MHLLLLRLEGGGGGECDATHCMLAACTHLTVRWHLCCFCPRRLRPAKPARSPSGSDRPHMLTYSAAKAHSPPFLRAWLQGLGCNNGQVVEVSLKGLLVGMSKDQIHGPNSTTTQQLHCQCCFLFEDISKISMWGGGFHKAAGLSTADRRADAIQCPRNGWLAAQLCINQKRAQHHPCCQSFSTGEQANGPLTASWLIVP